MLRRKGTASITEIAKALLAEDRSQLEYNEQITKNMVGRVLTHNRRITDRDGKNYLLKDFSYLSKPEIEKLIKLCDAKITEYLGKRNDPWSHRRKSTGYVPGTIKYEVLKRARSRCELCGVPKEQKALEVDHIIPLNKGGTNDISNFQALCYLCNASKRDRDDFRDMALRYEDRDSTCVLCQIQTNRVIAENRLCLAARDGYPVSPHHMLIIPKRHVSDFFELYQPELNALYSSAVSC